MRRFTSIALLVLIAGAVTVTATASKRAVQTTKGTVVGVISGNTLLVRLPAKPAKKPVAKKGKHAKPAPKPKPVPPTRVHVLGVLAPATSACYGPQAVAQVRSLTLGKAISMDGDLKKGVYVALSGTPDLGRALVGTGAAQVDPAAGAFSRVEDYVTLQEQAMHGAQGMWSACAADVSVTMSGPDSAFVGQDIKYNVTVSNAGPLTATAVELQLRPGNYAETLVSASAPSGPCAQKNWMAMCTINGIAAGGSATVTMVMRGSDFGALSARADAALVGCLGADCGTAPIFDPNNDNDHAAGVTILPGGGYVKACDPSYPTVCLPLTPPDLDCADFLPLKNFPVDYTVKNPDPHHLDGNHDGIACQGEDY
jgi:endonuclease YncB( thermonuclease family)